MPDTKEILYEFIKSNKGKTLTDVDCLSIDGVTNENVMGLLEQLENDCKINLDREYIRPSITLID